MAKLPKLRFVKFVRVKGTVYAYFNTGQTKAGGKPIFKRLPALHSVGFHDSYNAMMGARTKREVNDYTIADMAREYERSSTYRLLAPSSQEAYSKAIVRIIRHLGHWPVNDLERQDLQLVLDNEMAGAGAHNIFLSVLGVIYAWGRNRGKTDLTPTKGVEKMKTDPHKPWPDHVLEAALEAPHDRTRLAVHLLLFTGQRIGDVVKMRWSDIRDGMIKVTQQKTDKTLWIPLLNELADELERTPKRGLTIIVNENGAPMGDQVIRRELKAFTRAMGHETVPHGLRKNAVNAFLEAECSVAEVASMTGQTYRMVEHYAQQISQRRMAKAAVLKLENKRGKFKRDGKQAGK